MAITHNYRHSSCNFNTGLEAQLTTITKFLIESDIHSLLLVGKSIRLLILHVETIKRHLQDFEFIMTLGLSAFKGPISYLGAISDLRSIGQVCKMMRPIFHNRKTLKPMILRNLDRVLVRFGLSRMDHGKGGLNVILETTGAIIGGSVLLQCATGEIHDDNDMTDIDIYIRKNTRHCVEQYLIQNNYKHLPNRGPGNNDPEVAYGCNYIGGVMHYIHELSGMKIDLVIMRKDMWPQYAIGEYDFTFLMGLYDGENFEFWFPEEIMDRKGHYNTVSNVPFRYRVRCN
jgi:hypothetical protein